MKSLIHLKLTILHLIGCLGALLLLSRCVFTKAPLPSAQHPNITMIPKTWEGIYQTTGDKKAPLIGERYSEVKLLDPYRMVKITYKVFTEEMLKKHPHREYFQIIGDFLWYHNSALAQRLDTLNHKEALSEKEVQTKQELKEYDEKAGFHQVFQLKRKGKFFIYDEKLEHYLDLKKGILKTFPYTKNWDEKTYQANLKQLGDNYYLNVQTKMFDKADKKDGQLQYDWYQWFTVWIVDKGPEVAIKMIDFGTVLDQIDRYQKITPIPKPGSKNMAMNPSVTALQKMEKMPGFFKSVGRLKRVQLGGAPALVAAPDTSRSMFQFWHIAFLTVALLSFLILFLQQRFIS